LTFFRRGIKKREIITLNRIQESRMENHPKPDRLLSIFNKFSTSRKEGLTIALLSLTIFALILFSRTSYRDCDSLGCLLTSQAIVTHGTVKLDAYRAMLKQHEAVYTYRIITKNNHLYYRYPLGTCIYSVPFVWLANLTGQDMSTVINNNPVCDKRLQKVLSALIVTACFVLVYGLCRCFLAPLASFLLSLVFILGGPLISTMGAALWNLDMEVMFLLLALLMIVYDDRKIVAMNPYWLSFFLFSAYFCRPTAAIFVALVVLYVLLFKPRTTFIKLSLSCFLLFLVFVLFSLVEYQSILPPYYDQRLHSDTFWTGLYGNLLSPARGLFIYSPYLLLAFLGLCRFYKELIRSRLMWLAILWFCFHLVMIAKQPTWWGGHSFGPRYLTDVFPACILITILIWSYVSTTLSQRSRNVLITIFLCCSLISIFINTYQGLYNPATGKWNNSPNIDEYPIYLFDWKYPQFMATPKLLKEREIYHYLKYNRLLGK
jgi:hypothetical protein